MEKLQKRLTALKEKHAELDAKIAEEKTHPAPDDIKIQEYKKQKLLVKEEIEEVQKQLV